MNPVIAEAVAIFRESPNSSDEEILRKLVATGCDRFVAARLIEFVPMAYCRLVLSESGVRFSGFFQRKLADGRLSAEQSLTASPLWAEAVSFAEAEKKTGITGKALLVVAARSAEFDAANQLANQGSKLEDIVLMPTVFQWPEEGPEI
jgi:hypothetical protein